MAGGSKTTKAGIWCWAVCLLAASCAAPGTGTQTGTQPAPVAVGETLPVVLASMSGIARLNVRFVCQRRLVNLEVPLNSHGRMWFAAAGGAGAGGARGATTAERIATEWPYRSEIILADGKMQARSQHETAWTSTGVASRPGLTAVMAQMAAWATGSAGRLDMFRVTRGTGQIPPRPDVSAQGARPGAVFVLTPTGEGAGADLALSVKQVTLGFVPPGEARKTGQPTMLLCYVEIITAQGDASRYWFYDPVMNPEFPARLFSPENAPAAPPASGLSPGGSVIIPAKGG